MPIKPTNENSILAEQILNQVVDSINLVTQATTRLDERIKIISEKQHELEGKNEKMFDHYHNVSNRVTAVETKELPNAVNSLKSHVRELENTFKDLDKRLDKIEKHHQQSESRTFFFLDALWKIILMCITGYILFKLGVQAPPS